MNKPVEKVGTYIVRESSEGYNQLLIFAHKNHPEAPLQIPGGTIEPKETPREAVTREVKEETGLKKFKIVTKLGIATYYKTVLEQKIKRHFYLLRVTEETKDSWEQKVKGSGKDEGLIFSCRWVGPKEALLIHNEFHKFLTPDYLPTLFPEEVMLGLANKKISLLPDTDYWRQMFKQEKKLIKEQLMDSKVAIEHIGSTAIPDIPAKPIIDIGLGVPDLEQVEGEIELLAELGYQFKGEYGLPGRYYFVKGSSAEETYHLHMYEVSNPDWQNHLLFRDYLRANWELAREYGRLKLKLWREYRNNREEYTAAKEPFIKEVLEQAKGD